MATAIRSKSVARLSKVRAIRAIVDRFEDHTNHLLDYFVSYTRYTELSHLSIRLRYELSPNGFEAKLLGLQVLDNLLDVSSRESIQRFSIASGCHVSGFRLDSLIGEDVEIFLVHQPVEVSVDPLSIAIPFSQVFQSF